jgi:hypothetical protein
LVTSTRVPFIKVTNDYTSVTKRRLTCLLFASLSADGVHSGILIAKEDNFLQASTSISPDTMDVFTLSCFSAYIKLGF